MKADGRTLFWVLMISFLFAPVCNLCGNDSVLETKSPDGRKKAVVFQRDCGATTGFSTQVSILYAAESLPNDGGNTFIADGTHGVPVNEMGVMNLRIAWESNGILTITYPKLARIFKQETGVRGITIRYQEE